MDTRDLGGKFTIKNKTFPIYGGVNTVGRNREAIVNIKSLNISQHHAIFLLVDDDLHFISDLKSSNGTFLNGEPLAALQLYRIKNGSQIKFADIEGVYSQCSLEDPKLKSSDDSQYSQTYTQSFYGTDTQLIDNSCSLNQIDKTVHMQNSAYIPTQVLMNVANALETSYEKLHQQPTQLVVGRNNIHELPTQKVNFQVIDQNSIELRKNQKNLNKSSENNTTSECEYDQSIIALHEAETQKVIPDEKYEILKSLETSTSEDLLNYHEIETQLNPTEEKECGERVTISIENFNESPVQHNISENNKNLELSLEAIEVKQPNNSVADNLDSSSIKEQISNSESLEVQRPSVLSCTGEKSSQDSDQVKPLGINRNVLASQHLIDADLSNKILKSKKIVTATLESPILSVNFHSSDIEEQISESEEGEVQGSSLLSCTEEKISQDSDEVKPLGISKNILVSQHLKKGDSSSGNSDALKTVTHTLKSPVHENYNSGDMQEDGSNDSIDFMTMQKVIGTEKNYLEKDSDDRINMPENLVKDNSESHLEKNCDEDNSDTDSDIIRPVKKSFLVFNSSQETLIDEDNNCADILDEDTDDSLDFMSMQKVVDIEKKNSKNNRTEDDNIDSVTSKQHVCASDIENDITEKKSLQEVDSETDIENDENNVLQERNSEINNENLTVNIGKRKRNSCSSNPKKRIISRSKKKSNNTADLETDSDTDLTDINVVHSNKMNDDAKQKNGIVFRGVIHLTSLNDGASEANQKLVDETRIDESMQDSSGEPEVTMTHPVAEKTEFGLARRINESLNDSDFIPATQELAPSKAYFSQNSKFENSEESFKLGLTQLMEDNIDETGDCQKKLGGPIDTAEVDKTGHVENLDNAGSSNSQECRKKFVFRKKKSSDTSQRANITLDDDDIYEAKTQNVCKEAAETTSASKDDHIFLQPDQKFSKKKISTEKNLPEEEIYTLCTQKMNGSCDKADIDDIYLQSTQKLSSESCKNPLEETNKICLIQGDNNMQFNKETAVNSNEKTEYTNQDDDLNDMFATQTMFAKTTPKKNLEKELECMFATQKAIPTEDSLDKIKDVIFQLPIDSSKLPEEDSDLEAILATQKYPESPKTSKRHQKTDNSPISGRSIESQLEVLFHSQSNNLPSEKVSRPINPLANIFGKETESILSEVSNIETQVASLEDKAVEKKHVDDTQCSRLKNKITPQNALEQSIAFLETKSTRIRRSARNLNCENVTVSCPKSRQSLMIAPNEKFDSVLAEDSKDSKGKKGRPTIKRQSPNFSDSSNEIKESKKDEVVKKKRKVSESSNISEDDNCSTISSSSSRSTRAKRASKFLVSINEHQGDFEVEQISDKKLTSKLERKMETSDKTLYNKRSTRKNAKLVEEQGDAVINRKDENLLKSLSPIPNNKNHCAEKTSRKQQDITSTEKQQKLSSSASSSSTIDNQVDVSSRFSKRRCDNEVSTPFKTRKNNLATTPSTRRDVLEYQDSPNRNKRKGKTKVVFTMINDPKLESVIKLLGGAVVDSVDTCTVLITPSVKRSMKLLSAVGLGKPICSVNWIDDCKKKNQFLDPWEYLLIDKEAEMKWEFSLKVSLERSLLAKLFEGYTFQLLVKSTVDVLKGAIECCGGKIVTRCPKDIKNFIVVASPEQKDKYKKMLKQHPNLKVVEPEAIFDGVLRQEIRFERHLLNI